jgi:two-component system chemotaxis sensor kinase CheA
MPVSIATARIMVVEAGGQRFGISMDSVSETVRLTPDRISQVKQNEGFVLRDRVVPICSLAELMGLAGETRPEANTRLLIVIEAGAKIAAVEVDAIRARMEAILKPMQGLLVGARGYAGTTILGDGTVLLVLDLKEVLP